MTILVRNGSPCESCGGDAIDNKKTGKLAAKWRRAANVSQKTLAEKGMGIKQTYYSSLELGHRNWTPKLVADFEAAIMPVLKASKVDVGKL